MELTKLLYIFPKDGRSIDNVRMEIARKQEMKIIQQIDEMFVVILTGSLIPELNSASIEEPENFLFELGTPTNDQ